MRRGRFTILLAALVAATAAGFVAAPGASAADPRQICADLLDNGRLDGTYSQEELAASVASLQGYCPVTVTPQTPVTPVTPVTPPAVQVCTEVAAGTPGAQQAPNGKWYTNAPGGNAEQCGPAATAPAAQPATPGETPSAVAPIAAPGATPVQSGVLPAQATKVAQAAKAKGQPAAAAQPGTGVAGQQSPLRASKQQTGTLPFTGAELFVFALVGAALVAAGLLLRSTGRQKPTA